MLNSPAFKSDNILYVLFFLFFLPQQSLKVCSLFVCMLAGLHHKTQNSIKLC